MIDPRRWDSRTIRRLGYSLAPVLLVGSVVALAGPRRIPAPGVIGRGQPIPISQPMPVAAGPPALSPLEAIDPAMVVHRSAEIDPRFVLERSAEIDPQFVVDRAATDASGLRSFETLARSRSGADGR